MVINPHQQDFMENASKQNEEEVKSVILYFAIIKERSSHTNDAPFIHDGFMPFVWEAFTDTYNNSLDKKIQEICHPHLNSRTKMFIIGKYIQDIKLCI